MKYLACIVGSTVFAAACASPVPVTITELDTGDPQVWGGSLALDISDTGHIVGSYGSPRQAAAFEPYGQVVLVPIPPGYVTCRAVAVANDGRIAGDCTRSATEGPNLPTAFFADSARSTLQFIPLADNSEGTVLDMNDRGVILGRSQTLPDTSSLRHWMYDSTNGQLSYLPRVANSVMTRAASINDAGDVAGDAPVLSGATVNHQLVKWSADTLAITTTPMPEGQILDVRAINNRGNIVGMTHHASNANGSGHASFWSSVTGAEEPLPPPAIAPPYILQGTYANAVNDDGWIVGYARVSQVGSLGDGTIGIAWTPDRRVIQLGELGMNTSAKAINASEVIVGDRAGNAVRFDLGGTQGGDVTPTSMANRINAQ